MDSNAQLNTAVFLPNGMGIIGGGLRFETARILLSTDMGKSWQWKQMPGNTIGFFGSCIAPDHTLYLSGMYMKVCSSKDGMDNFNYKGLSDREEFISAISFGDNKTGIGVSTLGTDSGAVIRFDDQLNQISFQRFKHALWDVKMFSAQTGIAVGSGAVIKTEDGGQTWLRQSVIGDNFNSISALDSNHIYVSGLSGYIIKTSDGGKNWKRLRNGGDITLPDYQLWDLLFIDEQHGYAVGEKGLVIFTDDGGEHWSEFDRFTSNHLRFIALCPDGKLITGGENGTLFRLGR